MIYHDIVPRRDADLGFGVLPWAKGPEWELLEEYRFKVRAGNHETEYTIPDGYRFDKASIPPILWGFPFNYIPDGLCTAAALEHDALCDYYNGGSEWLREALGGHMPSSPPAQAIHRHFYDRLIQEGVRPRKAWCMWKAVSLFGPGGYLRPSTIWHSIWPW